MSTLFSKRFISVLLAAIPWQPALGCEPFEVVEANVLLDGGSVTLTMHKDGKVMTATADNSIERVASGYGPALLLNGEDLLPQSEAMLAVRVDLEEWRDKMRCGEVEKTPNSSEQLLAKCLSVAGFIQLFDMASPEHADSP